MSASRRDCLRAGGAVAVAGLAAGCAQTVERFARPTDLPGTPATASTSAYQALNRMAFGPAPGDIERVTAIALGAYVEEQLDPESIDEPRALAWRLNRYDTLEWRASDIYDARGNHVMDQLRDATLVRAVYSRRQLFEVMCDFWSNHFNIYQRDNSGKAEDTRLKTVDDREVVRKHALGRFREMVHASAKSPAMLHYLDNRQNTRGAPNENYARELMELHTLGVRGGYTQRDVQEVARCFTGWTVREQVFWRGDFLFDEDHHDTGPKVVLGRPIRSKGVKEGEEVIDRLCDHPSTARFLCRKLAYRFLGEAPPAVVAAMVKRWRATDGDIRQVLRPLLLSDHLDRGPVRLKRPFEFVASSLRALNAETVPGQGKPLRDALDAMGQPLFQWPMPNGYPEDSRAWTGTLVARWNFAQTLAAGRLDGVKTDFAALSGAGTLAERLDRLHRRVFAAPLAGAALEPAVRRHVVAALAAGAKETPALREALALMLASPAFHWR